MVYSKGLQRFQAQIHPTVSLSNKNLFPELPEMLHWSPVFSSVTCLRHYVTHFHDGCWFYHKHFKYGHNNKDFE